MKAPVALLFSFYTLWEEVLIEQISFGARSGALALRSSAETFLASGAHGTTTVF